MTIAAANRSTMKSFYYFLHTETGRRWYAPAVYERLLLAAPTIKSRAALERWMRERYPEQYKAYHWSAGCTGREAVQKLWAEYLKWCER
jgi:hypothetical protein